MQLDDGTEVKAYRLRKDDGTSDRWSAVYWIDEKGGVQQVYADQFTWEEEDEWTSPTTGLSYPTTVRIKAQHPTRECKIIGSVHCLITRNLLATVPIMPTGKVPAKYWILEAA